MNKKLMFVLFAVLMMAVMTVSVSADQDGLDRYCNSDQYGCWVTGDEGTQDYIMFWSESARDLFMGPGSNAVVTEPYPAGKMSLGKSSSIRSLVQQLADIWVVNEKWYQEQKGGEFNEGSVNKMIEKWNKLSDSEIVSKIQNEMGYYNTYVNPSTDDLQ